MCRLFMLFAAFKSAAAVVVVIELSTCVVVVAMMVLRDVSLLFGRHQ